MGVKYRKKGVNVVERPKHKKQLKIVDLRSSLWLRVSNWFNIMIRRAWEIKIPFIEYETENKLIKTI